jgi:hypothetical protein
MALSPADFYAYSRATGAPIPEDPEERAQMAPEVLEFRRNQLKAPQQESNPLGALGTAAAAVGALAGLGFGARALMRRGQQIPKGPAKSATAGVRQVNLAEMEQAVRRVAAEPPLSTPAPAPSKVATRSVMPTEEESFAKYARELSGAIPEPTAEELSFPAAQSRVYGAGYRERAAEPGYRSNALASLEKRYPPSTEVQAARRAAAQQDLLSAASRLQTNTESLTDIQKVQAVVNVDQFINAVESGEDQVTGRLIQKLNIADPWGQSTIPPSMVNEQQPTPLLPAAAVSPREKAQEFLQTRFEELGSVMPGRYRRERAMGQDPAIVEAMELYASTGDPAVLSRLSATPSSPLSVVPRVQTELREKEEIPTGMFFKPTGQGEFVDDLFEKDIALTNKISNLGAAKQDILNRLEEIDQLEPQLRFAAADEPEQGGYYTRILNKMMFERQSLNPDAINADLGDALVERDFVRSQMESLESLGSKYQMIPRQEGVRPFFEVDPVSGEPIAETLELRSGRPSVQLEEQKTGGGRYYSAYDPAAQLGSSVGPYGLERSSFAAGLSSPEMNIAPSASPGAYRLPAGSRAANKKTLGIVVSGGREYENYPELSQKLDQIISELNLPESTSLKIISGGAKGADTLAERYAQERGYSLQVFPANWKQRGLSAGTERNTEMAKAGDILVSFPGGAGTENMISQMTQKFGKPAYRAADIANSANLEQNLSSVNMSQAVLRAAKQQATRNPRGGVLPDEITTLRRQMAQPTGVEQVFTDVQETVSPIPPQQLGLEGVTGYSARQAKSPADLAAEQLENYMSKLQRGRSTPLTSEVVIQPRLV